MNLKNVGFFDVDFYYIEDYHSSCEEKCPDSHEVKIHAMRRKNVLLTAQKTCVTPFTYPTIICVNVIPVTIQICV